MTKEFAETVAARWRASYPNHHVVLEEIKPGEWEVRLFFAGVGQAATRDWAHGLGEQCRGGDAGQ